MPNEIFSYKNMNQKLIIEKQESLIDPETNYHARQGDNRGLGPDSFIFLSYLGDSDDIENKEGKIASKYGLKLHVSLPEWDRDKYAQGWDIVKDILIENKVNCSKIAHENIRMSDDNGSQRGKDITIYAVYHHDKDANFWLNIAQRITEELTNNNVPPGYPPLETGSRKDTRLEGSNYITYRYEKRDPPAQENILANLRVNVSNQMAPRQFVSEVKEDEEKIINAPSPK